MAVEKSREDRRLLTRLHDHDAAAPHQLWSWVGSPERMTVLRSHLEVPSSPVGWYRPRSRSGCPNLFDYLHEKRLAMQAKHKISEFNLLTKMFNEDIHPTRPECSGAPW